MIHEESDIKDNEDIDEAVSNESQDTYTVTLSSSCTIGNYDKGEFSLSLPMKSLTATEEILKRLGDYDQIESEDTLKWFNCFNEAKEAFIAGNSLSGSLERKGSKWHQDVAYNDRRLSIMRGSPLDSASEGNISGKEAVMKLNNALNLGAVVRVPLWHSGIWLSMKSPSSSMLITIDRLLASEKIVLGRQTNGMIYSNVSVYLRRILVGLALDCVVDASVIDYTRESLQQLIKITDYNILLWGLACSMYPDGYNILQPCVNDISKCQFIIEEKISLPKISWVDDSALTNDHKSYMWDSISNKCTREEVLSYQDKLKCNMSERVKVNDSFSLYLSVPNLKDDLENGIRWVESVISIVDDNFSEADLDEKIKNVRISEQARASSLRQYVSWISKCEVLVDSNNTAPSYITDRATLDMACESMTTSAQACEIIFKAIGTYIDNATINVIGIPEYDCPKCGGHNNGTSSLHPDIIPIAIDEVFFILIRHWTLKIINQKVTF